jgi:hypothetical protein
MKRFKKRNKEKQRCSKQLTLAPLDEPADAMGFHGETISPTTLQHDIGSKSSLTHSAKPDRLFFASLIVGTRGKMRKH